MIKKWILFVLMIGSMGVNAASDSAVYGGLNFSNILESTDYWAGSFH